MPPMVRDRDGSVNVFQNVCRHRGTPGPADQDPRHPHPYHSWSYGLNKLRTTPHVGGQGRTPMKTSPAELG